MTVDGELASLRHLLEALKSRAMSIIENGRDVTQREIDKLGPDIKFLEINSAKHVAK